MVQHFINSIRMHDYTVIDRATDAPPELISELKANWLSFDTLSRDIAVLMLERINSAASAAFLLVLTADPTMQVSASAARVFARQKHLPSGDSILTVIPARPNPFVRGKLYLAAASAVCGLDALRRVAAAETDAHAALQALAAMTRRAGIPETLAFFERVRQARADEVLDLSELLIYIGDPNLAKSMLPWLNSTEGVMRIGYDGGGRDEQARMCDFAVWNGKQLGLPTGAGPALINYDPALISRVRKLYSELPDPKPLPRP